MHRTLMKLRLVLTAAGVVLTGGTAGCYPGSISDVGEADLVVTRYDTGADFSTIRTYVMPDTIVRVGESGSDHGIDRTYDQQILDEIEDQLDALGYERIDGRSATPPDFIVLAAANSAAYEFWVPGGWWGYWGWYPGWARWYPGWGPSHYPGYPWGGYGGTYQAGSLAVVMLDPISAGEEIPAIWAGVANGLLSSTAASTAARVLDAVAQMFVQSPYLGR